MDPVVAATVGGGVGLVLGALAVLATRLSERVQRGVPASPPTQSLPRGVGDVLSVLRSIGIVLDASDAVVNTSSSAVAYGLVRHGELVHQELRQLARAVRRDGVIREAELDLTRGAGGASTVMKTRVAPLGSAHVLVLAEDHTQARRVEEVRRDFVANISHELKTPVGGISLLSEAIVDARDDPEAVARFGERIRVESDRLTRLVKEIVDLSRLQVQDTLHEPELVDMNRVVAEAVDRVRVTAEARSITIDVAIEDDLAVYGDRELLTTAIGNLVSNAVNYSDDQTKVAVGGRLAEEIVEIAVTDQGHGIPASEQERIFERFYRVDAARSRATGGTGLGLAIVKHICANHGGDVSVWSAEGHGSTFTVRLPLAAPKPVAPPHIRATATRPNPTSAHDSARILAPGTPVQGELSA